MIKFRKKDEDKPGEAKAPLKPVITARVYRAATKTWEAIDVTVRERR